MEGRGKEGGMACNDLSQDYSMFLNYPAVIPGLFVEAVQLFSAYIVGPCICCVIVIVHYYFENDCAVFA